MDIYDESGSLVGRAPVSRIGDKDPNKPLSETTWAERPYIAKSPGIVDGKDGMLPSRPDIISRLRENIEFFDTQQAGFLAKEALLRNQAADEIARLRAKVADLEYANDGLGDDLRFLRGG